MRSLAQSFSASVFRSSSLSSPQLRGGHKIHRFGGSFHNSQIDLLIYSGSACFGGHEILLRGGLIARSLVVSLRGAETGRWLDDRRASGPVGPPGRYVAQE